MFSKDETDLNTKTFEKPTIAKSRHTEQTTASHEQITFGVPEQEHETKCQAGAKVHAKHMSDEVSFRPTIALMHPRSEFLNALHIFCAFDGTSGCY